jgi:hypothetical protein
VVESFKSEVAGIATLSDMEDFLRDVGNLSKSMACTLLGQMKTLCRGDSGKQSQELDRLMDTLKTHDLKALLKSVSLKRK